MNIIIDTDVLTQDERDLLLAYANGHSANAIAKQLECSQAELRTIELDARAKLGAKNGPHLLSRAWQLGILRNSLSVLLIILSLTPSDDVLRNARKRTNRTPQTFTRVLNGNVGRNLEA